MKFIALTLLIAIALPVGGGSSKAKSIWDQLSETAPKSVFDDIRDGAPRSVFDDLQASAPVAGPECGPADFVGE